ncbi:MAG: polysaccharide biosynthesis protein [Crocinitomicaceae bacterium]|nr:polysaccharide biosynthesis protein [Crocinitomicaceae bacterium]
MDKPLIQLPSISTPRWVVVVLDLIIGIIALLIAYLVRFEVYANWSAVKKEFDNILVILPFFLLVKFLVFQAYKIHKGLIRHTSFEDIRRLFFAVATSSAVFAVFSVVRSNWLDGKYFVPISVLIMEFLISFVLLMGVRFMIKVYYYELSKSDKANQKLVLIYGAGVSGLIMKRTIEKEPKAAMKIIGYLDDNPKLAGNRLEGITIYHTSKLDELLQQNEVDVLIVAIQKPDKANANIVLEKCLQYNIEVQSVPSFQAWVNGEFSIKQIRKVTIEELLGRKPIVLDEDKISQFLQEKVILITGAAGSIGSGMVRIVANYRPAKIILLDQAESALYDFDQELKASELDSSIELVIADIRNVARMDNVFKHYQPSVVFHAAAYKHVPLMEENPSEALMTNVLGTKNMVDLADKYNVQKFVMISTDKAVNPTNVMGASKRIAEMYAQWKNTVSSTEYVTTRFGNVLGSNGSVIPLFKKQIAQGGPVTVTDPEVTRFFMTIPEACQLVLEASVIGNGGEIFVFDMGESVKIIDLAYKMIKLSGLQPNKDIEIKITGLRPGEKLYEELLANEENTLPTHHPQILRAKSKEANSEIDESIIDLIALFAEQNNEAIVAKMKEIVPEYISNNSIFSKLDQ